MTHLAGRLTLISFALEAIEEAASSEQLIISIRHVSCWIEWCLSRKRLGRLKDLDLRHYLLQRCKSKIQLVTNRFTPYLKPPSLVAGSTRFVEEKCGSHGNAF